MIKLLNLTGIILTLLSNWSVQAANIDIVDAQGNTVGSYHKSYALLIGNSEYQSIGWQPLTQVSAVLNRVTTTLEKQGFQVTQRLNLNTQQFEMAIDKFIQTYGTQKENRLLFFFMGHSYIHFLSQNSYFITTDTPLPEQGQFKFLEKAIVIDKVIDWAEKIQSNHALFIFDTCLAGSIFNSSEITRQPIENKTMLPSRNFIAACGKDEMQPTEEMFSRIFINALQYGWGDSDADGYVTSTELAHYIRQELPQHTDQTPQIGVINNNTLTQGDFIFKAAHEIVSEEDAKLFPVEEVIADEPIVSKEEKSIIDVIAEPTTIATTQMTVKVDKSDEKPEAIKETAANIESVKVVEKPVEQAEKPIAAEPIAASMEAMLSMVETTPTISEEVVETPVDEPVVEATTTEQPIESTDENNNFVLHTITKNDSLWNIAVATLPKGEKNIDKHMKNIHKLNSHAFIKNNINLLIEGQVLKIPATRESN